MAWTVKAIDISHYQPNVDFVKLKASGIIGVIIKASEATKRDPLCRIHAAGALKAGLRVGFYHFIRPGLVGPQVEAFMAAAKPGDDAMMALDYELPKIPTVAAHEFLSILEQKLGRKGVFYSYASMIKQKFGTHVDPYIKQHRLWLAQYSHKPSALTMWSSPWLWQSSGSGSINGVRGKVDIDKYAGTDAQLEKEWA